MATLVRRLAPTNAEAGLLRMLDAPPTCEQHSTSVSADDCRNKPRSDWVPRREIGSCPFSTNFAVSRIFFLLSLVVVVRWRAILRGDGRLGVVVQTAGL